MRCVFHIDELQRSVALDCSCISRTGLAAGKDCIAVARRLSADQYPTSLNAMNPSMEAGRNSCFARSEKWDIGRPEKETNRRIYSLASYRCQQGVVGKRSLIQWPTSGKSRK